MIQNFNKIEKQTLQMNIYNHNGLYMVEEAWVEEDMEWHGRATLKAINRNEGAPSFVCLILTKNPNKEHYELSVSDMDTNNTIYSMYFVRPMYALESSQNFLNYLSTVIYRK